MNPKERPSRDDARQPSMGDLIRQKRQELGWTQEELADRVSVLGDEITQSDISRIERGDVRLPRIERLTAIARALDLNLVDLLMTSSWGQGQRDEESGE